MKGIQIIRFAWMFLLVTSTHSLFSGYIFAQPPTEGPAPASVAGLGEKLQSEIKNVEEQLERTKAALDLVGQELNDVKQIATMPGEPMPEEKDKVSQTHLNLIEPAERTAISLHATPVGASLTKFVDTLVEIQTKYDKANKLLQKKITNKELEKKLQSIGLEEAPVIEAETPKPAPIKEVEAIMPSEEVEEEPEEAEEITPEPVEAEEIAPEPVEKSEEPPKVEPEVTPFEEIPAETTTETPPKPMAVPSTPEEAITEPTEPEEDLGSSEAAIMGILEGV